MERLVLLRELSAPAGSRGVGTHGTESGLQLNVSLCGEVM
jgi:hypothetical protein